MYQGFDSTPSGWAGVRLTKRDFGFDYVKTGADSAVVIGGTTHPMRQTASVLVPARGKLRITYAIVPFAPVVGHGTLHYRLTATGALHGLPTPAVNPAPWGISPGWSSAKWDLSSLAGKRIYLHFNTDDSSASVSFVVDDVRVYSCG